MPNIKAFGHLVPEKIVEVCCHITLCKIMWPLGRDQYRPKGHDLNNIGRGQQYHMPNMAYYTAWIGVSEWSVWSGVLQWSFGVESRSGVVGCKSHFLFISFFRIKETLFILSYTVHFGYLHTHFVKQKYANKRSMRINENHILWCLASFFQLHEC